MCLCISQYTAYICRVTVSMEKRIEQKGALRNFAKFTGKHLCESLFFNKIGGLRP